MRVALVLTFLLALVPARTFAGDTAFKVIVHPNNPVTSVDRDFLRNAYLKKETVWRKDLTIRPVDLTTKFPVRAAFVHDVLKKSPSQLKTYWNQQIFSGKGVPPPELGSIADVIAYVLATPGAVAYIPADADEHGAKVVEVR